MLGAHTMEKLSTDCGGDFHCFIGDILKPLQLQPPDWLAGLLEPSAHTLRRAATDERQGCKIDDRRFAHCPLRIPPDNQPKRLSRRCDSLIAYWKTRLTCVTVLPLVSANCSSRLRSQDAVNGTAVITGASEPALQLGHSGSAGIAILAIAIAVAVVAVLVSSIAVAITVAIGGTIAVGITVAVVPIWVASVPAPAPGRTPAPTPPPRKAEATNENDIVVTMMVVPIAIPIAAAPIAAAPVPSTPVPTTPALAAPRAHPRTRTH
jgi:hypothetical protein